MRAAFVVACKAVTALAGFGAGGAAAAGLTGPVIADWGSNATSLRGQGGAQFAVVCPAGGALGSVWGTDTYTDDSSVCSAAAHAGLASLTAGGSATIEIRPGAASYTGSARNGVTSSSYGSWSGSFVFPAAKPVGTTTTTTPPATPATAKPPASTTTATSAGATAGGSGWAVDTRAYRGKIGSLYRASSARRAAG